MTNTAIRVLKAVQAAGVPVISVTIGDDAIRATWKVQPVNLQSAAQATIDAFDPEAPTVVDAEVSAAALLSSRQKDILSTCAVIVRSRDLAAWTAMNLTQKKAATFAEADVWRAMREFAEKNL